MPWGAAIWLCGAPMSAIADKWPLPWQQRTTAPCENPPWELFTIWMIESGGRCDERMILILSFQYFLSTSWPIDSFQNPLDWRVRVSILDLVFQDYWYLIPCRFGGNGGRLEENPKPWTRRHSRRNQNWETSHKREKGEIFGESSFYSEPRDNKVIHNGKVWYTRVVKIIYRHMGIALFKLFQSNVEYVI